LTSAFAYHLVTQASKAGNSLDFAKLGRGQGGGRGRVTTFMSHWGRAEMLRVQRGGNLRRFASRVPDIEFFCLNGKTDWRTVVKLLAADRWPWRGCHATYEEDPYSRAARCRRRGQPRHYVRRTALVSIHCEKDLGSQYRTESPQSAAAPHPYSESLGRFQGGHTSVRSDTGPPPPRAARAAIQGRVEGGRLTVGARDSATRVVASYNPWVLTSLARHPGRMSAG